MKLRGFFKVVVVVVFFMAAYGVCKFSPFYIDRVHYAKDEIRIIIDDLEVTKSLPDKVIMQEGEVLLSTDTIKKYFDKYPYFDVKYNTVIISSGEYVVKMPLDSKNILINGEEKSISVAAQKINDIYTATYIPAEEIFSICDISGEKINNKLLQMAKDFSDEYATDFSVIAMINEVINNEEDNKKFFDINEFTLDEIKNRKNLLEKPIKIDGKVLFTTKLISEYFDVNIEVDDENITVKSIDYDGDDSNNNVLVMPLNSKEIMLNGSVKSINVPAHKVETERDVIYVPIKELSDVYDIEILFNEKVIITTKNANFYSVVVNNKIHTKKYKQELCLTTEVVSKNEKLEIFNSDFNELDVDEYVWVRTEEGSLGYVKKSNIGIESVISEPNMLNESTEQNVMPKISLTWEYAANYIPDRSSEEKIDALDIVSPTWVYVKNVSGELKENVSQSYISWAKAQGYDVWPTIKNDDIGIDKTSILLNDMHARQAFIDNVIKICEKYNFKGINLDFEHMYKRDREEYAQLVSELSSTLRLNGIISSVDVNVPDGSDNWSLCFDSKAISDSVDYIIVMAYDQYGASSSKSGPVASLDWVELNLKKMIQRDGIDNKKLVLGVPFYSRLWKEKNGVVTSTSALGMSRAIEYMKDNPNSTTWVESAGQYRVQYSTRKGDVIVWVEDENSLEKKLELMNKYELAGVASWRRGFETEEVWKKIEDAMK